MSEKVVYTNNLITGYLDKGEKKRVIGNYNQLSLNKGDFNVLIGRNGVGKSTLLKTLSGELVPLEGEVEINNIAVSKLTNAQKSVVLSFVFSNTNIVGKLTVIETVLMGRYPYVNWWGKLGAKDHEIAEQALKDVDAYSFKDRYVQTLSDGERQKVMIARAIAQDTHIIFLDEPSAHLDLPNRIEVFQLLKKIARKRNKAILLSTHEIEMSLQIADQLWILHDQKITIGSPAEIVSTNFINTIFSSESIAFNSKTGVFNFCALEKLFSFQLKPNSSISDYSGEINLQIRLEWEVRKLISEGAFESEVPDFEIQLCFNQEEDKLEWVIDTIKNRSTINLKGNNLFKILLGLYLKNK